LLGKLINFLSHTPKDVQVRMLTINSIYGMKLTPAKKGSQIIMYIYGGAFVIDLDTVKNLILPFTATLAKTAETEIWIPQCRTAPEHPFPAQGEDYFASYMNLLDQGYKPEDITILGVGSGAALGLALLFTLRDQGLPLPGGVVTISAWTDLSLTGESFLKRSDRDPLLKVEAITGYFNHYLQGSSTLHPQASPYYGDFTGFPPMYMMVGGCEIFYDDTIRVAKKAKAVGVNVTLDVEEEMFYNYLLFCHIIPEGMRGIERLAGFIRNRHKQMKTLLENKIQTKAHQ
jgi:monoterpene epsilon-lactone hydrolase